MILLLEIQFWKRFNSFVRVENTAAAAVCSNIRSVVSPSILYHTHAAAATTTTNWFWVFTFASVFFLNRFVVLCIVFLFFSLFSFHLLHSLYIRIGCYIKKKIHPLPCHLYLTGASLKNIHLLIQFSQFLQFICYFAQCRVSAVLQQFLCVSNHEVDYTIFFFLFTMGRWSVCVF